MENNQPGGRQTAQSVAIPAASIICDEVTRQFTTQPRPAVDHVSLSVAAGELVVLLGPSGCGKTTLLKMINRLYEPTSGQICIGGRDIESLPVTDLRRQIGYVIQQVGLFPHMTVAANIAVVPRLLGWKKDRITERTAYLLDMVQLPASYLKRYPRQLSGGEQQRVGLARALAADPSTLLMDEPFAALDAINRGRMQCELLEIQQKVRKTIIFVTHDVEEAFHLADKIAIMAAGRLIQFGAPLDIVSRPQDAFVEELVETGNILRQLSLINVQTILDLKPAWNANSSPGLQAVSEGNKSKDAPIRPDDDLRKVLSLMLSLGTDQLEVTASDGVQTISMGDLHRILVENFRHSREDG